MKTCMVFKTIEGTRRDADRVAKAWRAQEGAYYVAVERMPLSRSYVVRAYLPLPAGPLPDGCYVGVVP